MSGGARFWAHLGAHPDQAATFDAAMHVMSHLGGAAAVAGVAWGRYGRVVDVGGGVGGFLAAILERHAGLHGLLLDQPGPVARAQKVRCGGGASCCPAGLCRWAPPPGCSTAWRAQVWHAQHAELLPRATLAAGDMFSAADMRRLCGCGSGGAGGAQSTDGSSRSGDDSSCFVLRNILHDHDDGACLVLLRNIRAAIGSATACRLLVVEATTVEDVLPCHLAQRCVLPCHTHVCACAVHMAWNACRTSRSPRRRFAPRARAPMHQAHLGPDDAGNVWRRQGARARRV